MAVHTDKSEYPVNVVINASFPADDPFWTFVVRPSSSFERKEEAGDSPLLF